MKTILQYTLFTLLALPLTSCQSKNERARDLAREAYIYAFAAVDHNKAVWSILDRFETPPNRFIANTHLFGPENAVVVSPNNDTYYAYAVLDISREPVVVTIPAIEGRYFCIQLCDIFTDCPDYISSRATGDGPGHYLVARSDWNGTVPENIDRVIKIPATFALALARTQVFDTDDTRAAEISQSYEAQPLSQFAGTTPPTGEPLTWPYPYFDAKTGDAEGFFGMFNTMVQYQLLTDTDQRLMKKFESLGLSPGKRFSRSDFDPAVWAEIEAGAEAGRNEIRLQADRIGENVNNWNFSPVNAGRWGTDYMTRAATAWKYIYANIPEEAVYIIANADSEGQPLSGAHRYTVTFPADRIPRVEYFWSLTMYNGKGYLVENPAGRYTIKDRDNLVYGRDGSLTLCIQSENPAEEHRNNWLPAPDGEFYMVLRLYGPPEEAIRGDYQIPAVIKTR